MTAIPHETSFGAFKPVGHVLMSFLNEAAADSAVLQLQAAGFAADTLVRYTPQQMVAQADEDLRSATLMAAIGQELNLVKAQRVLAVQGQFFVLVPADTDETLAQVTAVAQATGATRAQRYGQLIIEELVPAIFPLEPAKTEAT